MVDPTPTSDPAAALIEQLAEQNELLRDTVNEAVGRIHAMHRGPARDDADWLRCRTSNLCKRAARLFRDGEGGQ